ncbi:F1 capsule-anchoring protein precursor [Oligella ureolytica]|uniref:F1 capsule-anchoring protein n=1 Tax=Oligella ureolytica TaxID=90244 RepID=A0A378XCE8_9BURK|nr:fimbria/pilus outer membrane usher protein [Oligella ureolytica]QPT40503.1 fimbrial biogenesis outer membrane usher protein [Oligella ureolytica]SUA51337.1 F1 capsule-anchoring protein precursor [Oligella ureolytica]
MLPVKRHKAFVVQKMPLSRLSICGFLLIGLQPIHVNAQDIPPAISPSELRLLQEAQADFNTVYLLVTLNGNKLPDLLPFTVKQGQLYTSPDVLLSMGFKDLDSSSPLLALDQIAGLQQHYQQEVQALSLTIPLDRLDHERRAFIQSSSPDIEVSKGTGLLLNYDLYSSYSSDKYKSLSLFAEGRFFTPYGVLSNTALYQSNYSPFNRRWHNQAVRLDTQWETSWQSAAISLRLGDTLTASLPWSRSTRIGGIQLSRNFALQPYLSTAPLPSFLGEAAVPSTAELYINGIKQYEQNVPSGPFEIQTMPYINGAGNATMVLTDTQGRQQSMSLPFYSTTMLLRQGLADWSIEAGYVRKDYGIRSDRYAKEEVFSGTLRYGLTNSITTELHAEGSRELLNYGVGANIRLGQLGVFTGSIANSRLDDKAFAKESGRQHSLGYQWQGKYFHVNASLTKANRKYKDIASLYGSEHPEINQTISTGINLGEWGSLGVSYIKLGYFEQEENRYVNAYWSKSIGRSTYVSINYNKSLSGNGSSSVYAGISFSLGDNYRVSSAVNHSDGQQRYTVDVNKTRRDNMGWSWNLHGSHAEDVSALHANADYRGRYGDYGVGARVDNNQQAAYLSTRGSVVAMSGGVFPGRQITDGFAVVSTNGIADVPVKLQNNRYGTTNRRGLLLVAPLNAYQHNKIDIDTMTLPANMSIDKVSTDISTQAKSGTRVLFKIEPIRAATVLLQDAQGEALKLGTQVVLNGKHSTMVGYDGIAYLDKLEDSNRLEVSGEQISCTIEFDFKLEEATIPQLGPFVCR